MAKKKAATGCRIVGVRFSDKVYRKIVKIAEAEKRPVSSMLRMLIEKHVERGEAA